MKVECGKVKSKPEVLILIIILERSNRRSMSKLTTIVIFMVVALVLLGCTTAPVQNDGDHSYRTLKHVEVDRGYYPITGEVVGLPVMNEFTGVETMPYRFLGNDDQNNSPVHVMRILVTESSPIAEEGFPVGLKVYGSMMNSILVGDTITLLCRLQNEAVGAVAPQETFDANKALVKELENCRPLSPIMDEDPSGR